MTSKTGGRQGCKLGATVFNTSYSLALKLLKSRLSAAGITFKIKIPGGAFWDVRGNTDDLEEVEALDAAFVDDECLVVLARSPVEMDRAITIVLDTIQTIFRATAMQMNWSPGKTECLLRYRGRHAVRHLGQWRSAEGELAIPLSHAGESLSIVHHYEHRGGYVCVNGDLGKEADHRASNEDSLHRRSRRRGGRPHHSALTNCGPILPHMRKEDFS